ncbi:MAG TPA: hypothetical protein VNO35_11575 [Steroidobacteraceae bacterium]|nr:hypothetical protein [Steroidobacteraceae bacterium]
MAPAAFFGANWLAGKDLGPWTRRGNRHHQLVEEIVEPGRRCEINGLCQVVLRAVVTDLVPFAVALFGHGARVVTEYEADSRHALEKERELVSAPQKVPLGFGILAKLYIQGSSNALCDVPQGRILECLDRQDIQRK